MVHQKENPTEAGPRMVFHTLIREDGVLVQGTPRAFWRMSLRPECLDSHF